MQAKLLHVLDRSEIRPVGATRSRKVNARVICATGCDLRDRIKEGRRRRLVGGRAAVRNGEVG